MRRGNTVRHLPAFYSLKLAYGPEIRRATAADGFPIQLDDPLADTLERVARALGKRVQDLVVATLNRPRHGDIIASVRSAGAALRMVK